MGWANGYRLFPMADLRIRRSDPDLGANEGDFLWLSKTHGTSIEDLRKMTLAGGGSLLMDGSRHRHFPWWIPPRYGTRLPGRGAMYCPSCLAEDDVPHFRLSWRFAFNYACLKHETQLIDQCPACGVPPWPGGCGVLDHVHPRFQSHGCCWQCGFDMRQTRPIECRQVTQPQSWLSDGVCDLANSHVPTSEMFSALRAVCQLFIRTRSRDLILLNSDRWSSIAKQVDPFSSEDVIERLPVAVRADLVPAAVSLILDWPHSFLTFANECGISRTHFNGTYHLSPAWFNECVDQNLARQNRWVSAAMIRNAVVELRREGEAPTKHKVRKRLRWQGDFSAELLLVDEGLQSDT